MRIEQGLVKPCAYGSATRLDFARSTITAYEKLVETWANDTLDDEGRPHPIATLRIVPPV